MITLNPRILEPYEPVESASHWCNLCDHHVVNSDDKKSGEFFVFFGHEYDSKARLYCGKYKGVMLAFCRACLDAKE